MGYDRGDSFPFDFLNQMEFDVVQNADYLSILNQMDFHLAQKFERKTVTTIISHSIWKKLEI